jgi:hypothetical protein
LVGVRLSIAIVHLAETLEESVKIFQSVFDPFHTIFDPFHSVFEPYLRPFEPG